MKHHCVWTFLYTKDRDSRVPNLQNFSFDFEVVSGGDISPYDMCANFLI